MSILDPIRRVQRLREADRRRETWDQGIGRLPPGQVLTQKFPVLHYGHIPHINLSDWSFEAWGLVKQPINLDWEAFNTLPQTTVTADVHCVTRWSKFDTTWTGVAGKDILNLIEPRPEATHVMVHAYGGYTANLPIGALRDEDVVFATCYDGRPLPREHGWPMRLVVPKRYFWKSAKWCRGLEFMPRDRRGFWEIYGYHNDGDPWKEERLG
ncbi:MAG: sulfite oxidase-like oxidoreductase [Anaerolineae bacterium]